MKLFLSLLAVTGVMTLSMSSCSKNEGFLDVMDNEENLNSSLKSRSVVLNDSAFIEEISKTNLEKPANVPISARDLGIDGILETPVNISVVRNIYKDMYLKYNGLNQEITFSQFDSNNEDLKFLIHRMPLTGQYYFTPYRLSDNKYLLSSGHWVNNPSVPSDVNILYVKDTGNSLGTVWDITKGKSENSFVLYNSDLLEQGPGGWMDVYSLALCCQDNAVRFTKYTGLPEQEFKISPCETFQIVSLTVDDDMSTISAAPSFVITKTFNNNGSTEQTFETGITERAKKTSTFNRNTSISTKVDTSIKVGAFFAENKITVSVGNNYEWSYGSSEEHEDTRNYNFPLIVAPFKNVRAVLTVTRTLASMNYTAVLKGMETGTLITESGTWDNVDCTTIKIDLQETDSSGKVTATRTLNEVPNGPVRVTE